MSDMVSKETVKCSLIESICFSETETRRVKQSLNDGFQKRKTYFIKQKQKER